MVLSSCWSAACLAGAALWHFLLATLYACFNPFGGPSARTCFVFRSRPSAPTLLADPPKKLRAQWSGGTRTALGRRYCQTRLA